MKIHAIHIKEDDLSCEVLITVKVSEYGDHVNIKRVKGSNIFDILISKDSDFGLFPASSFSIHDDYRSLFAMLGFSFQQCDQVYCWLAGTPYGNWQQCTDLFNSL